MVSGKLVLKSINDLFGEQFVIPAYQRGYRWTKRQVTDLLDDIREFQPKEKKEFYCIQPIVVKKDEERPDQWEVIDGQQRLTTIFIIIKFLAASLGIKSADQYRSEFMNTLYSIEYGIRRESKAFLENIIGESEGGSSPDYFYMSNAFRTVKDWCERLDRNQRDKLLGKIVGRDDVEHNEYAKCKVIWYEVDDQSNGPELFARLNIGKIPLTNSELVKALFLSRSTDNNSESHQEEIALLWDEMEQQLHQDDFWAFITSEEEQQYPNRIEFLFDMITQKRSTIDEFHTFLHFFNALNEKTATPWGLWREIENCYQTLREWYHDRDLYHQIGYLVNIAGKTKGREVLEKLLTDSLVKEKHEFRSIIRDKISLSLGKVGKQPKDGQHCGIDELDYRSDYSIISRLLLLFNIESVRRNVHSAERYPFKSSKAGNWNLEHIHAQASKSLDETKREIWVKWTEEHKKPLEELVIHLENESFSRLASATSLDKAKAVLAKVEEFLMKPEIWTHAKFHEELYQPIIALFTESAEESGVEDYIHSIANLALLKQGENSAFSNSVFEVKRQKMLAADKKGAYIPVCTRRVFLKYYTEDISDVHTYFWGKKDRAAYLDEMKKVLKDYLPEQDMWEDES